MAMFLLRVTSDPSLNGRLTDDDFEIGAFTGSSIFLIALCTAAGVLGGLFYLVVRTWLPETRRMLLFGAFGGLVGGAAVVEPGGIDFTRVEPRPLSIALFILLPALYGMSVSFLAERFLTKKETRTSTLIAFLPLLGLAILGPVGLAVAVVAFIGWMLNFRLPVVTWWSSPWVTQLGRIGLAGIAAFCLLTLTLDITEIL